MKVEILEVENPPPSTQDNSGRVYGETGEAPKVLTELKSKNYLKTKIPPSSILREGKKKKKKEIPGSRPH